MKQKIMVWLISHLIYLIHKFLTLTIRWTFVGERPQGDQPYILGFWHARLLMIPHAIKRWNGSVMISEHRDGAFIAEAARLMGINSARGSSTRSGARALLAMIRLAKSGKPLAITPDGPKGPKEVMQMGTVQLAKKSGLPLHPICYASKHYWRVNSWDRFYIPKPFTCGVFVFGEPVYADADDDEQNLKCFQQAMDETQRLADDYFSALPRQ